MEKETNMWKGQNQVLQQAKPASHRQGGGGLKVTKRQNLRRWRRDLRLAPEQAAAARAAIALPFGKCRGRRSSGPRSPHNIGSDLQILRSRLGGYKSLRINRSRPFRAATCEAD
jgi:hypothetical protein